ncbi:MAG: hypothetical protein V1808_00600 [Candidatus Daviesbacteria bacterium]
MAEKITEDLKQQYLEQRKKVTELISYAARSPGNTNEVSVKLSGELLDLIKLRKETLEQSLSDLGLEVCHSAGIHYFTSLPTDWSLSRKEWNLGIFPREDARRLYYATTKKGFGGSTLNPPPKIIDPELIILCPKHYPTFDVKEEFKEEANGRLVNLQSGVRNIRDNEEKLRLIADPYAIIEKTIARHFSESVYRYFGL